MVGGWWLALLGYVALGGAALVALAALAGHAVFLARRARRPEAVDGKEAFFDAPSGARLCYLVHGDQAAASQYVVYFSGLLGSRHEHFGARFPEDPAHCVITLDRPGYGHSPFFARPARSYRQTGTDVVALMRSLGVRAGTAVAARPPPNAAPARRPTRRLTSSPSSGGAAGALMPWPALSRPRSPSPTVVRCRAPDQPVARVMSRPRPCPQSWSPPTRHGALYRRRCPTASTPSSWCW